MVLIAVFIGTRDYLQSSSNEKDFLLETLYQQYLDSNDEAVGKIILLDHPNTIYSDFVRLSEAKRNFESGEIDVAIELLEAVKDNNSSDEDFNPLFAAATSIYITENSVCAVSTDPANPAAGACAGDSGGPMIVTNPDGEDELVGIIDGIRE